MATTNLNLNTLAGTEKLKSFPTPYNENMGAIDDAFGSGFGVGSNSSVDDELNGLGNGMAIIANGNTHAAITSGQYVYVRQHGSLSEGLYKATSNISANGTLSGSNLTAVSSGGLNELNSKLNGSLTFTPETGVTVTSESIGSVGNMAYGTMEMQVTATQNTWITLGTFNKNPYQYASPVVPCVRTGNGTYSGMVQISREHGVRLYSTQGLSNNAISFSFAYKIIE